MPVDVAAAGHEYTLSNAKFAESVSLAQAIRDLIKECEKYSVTPGRFTIADEKLDVPFP
jgi:Hydroxyacylglutathione hydrolase C-terminus